MKEPVIGSRADLVMPGRPTLLYRPLLDGALPTVRGKSAISDLPVTKGTFGGLPRPDGCQTDLARTLQTAY
jgi:hypothetical protein